MEIDLGQRPVASVKVGGDEYKMSIPTVRQSMKFSKVVDACADDYDKTELFVKFMTELGLPENVVDELSIHQMSKLAEGLIGSAEKK